MSYSEIHDFSEVQSDWLSYKDGNEFYSALSEDLQAKLDAMPWDKAMEIITSIIQDFDNRVSSAYDIALDTTAAQLLGS